MAETTVPSAILAEFTEGETGGAVTTCCNDVQGDWQRAPGALLAPDIFIDGVPEPLGNPEVAPTYYLDTIPRGLKFSLKFRYRLSVRGILVCLCADDGRELSRSPFNKKITLDIQTFVGSVTVVRIPVLGWLGYVIDGLKMLKEGYEIYNLTPEKIRELAGDAIELALKEVRESSTTLCRLKHKPCSSPGTPVDPVPVDPAPIDPSLLLS